MQRNLLNKLYVSVRHPKTLGVLCLVIVALLCFLTPLTSSVPVFGAFSSYYYNLSLRLCYALLSILLLIGTIGQPISKKISIGGWFLLAFWIVYSFRFLHDTLIEGVVIRGNLFKLYAIAFGNCLLPAVVCLRASKFVDFGRSIEFFRWSLILSCLSVLVVSYKVHGTLNPTVLGRARFTVELDANSTYQALNPITIGFFGESLTLFSLGLILFGKKVGVFRWYDYFAFILGFFTLILGASRGPALGTFLGVLSILICYTYYFRKTATKLIKVVATSLVVLLATVFWVMPKVLTNDITLIRRIVDLGENLSSNNGPREFRSYQWESAVEMFLNNPVVGDRYLERFANFYPHNVYLEVFMSTGLVGAMFFYGMLGVVFFTVLKAVRIKSSMIILFWPLFAIFMWMLTSGSVFEGVALWTYIAFWLGLNKKNEETVVN